VELFVINFGIGGDLDVVGDVAVGELAAHYVWVLGEGGVCRRYNPYVVRDTRVVIAEY
jgi:hypothetical protein